MALQFDGKTQFSDLPSYLVIDILLRLPLKSLLACRCVCKDLIRLFRDPSFIELHLAASPIHILNRQLRRKDGIFQFWQVLEDLEVNIVNLHTKFHLLNFPHFNEIYDYGCVNSCNGLLCLVDGDSYFSRSFVRSVCVCNPILGEWLSISTPVRNYPPGFLSETTMALVFSAKNNQYKLLHGFKTAEKNYGFEIYTLGGTREWRSIDETLVCRPWSGFFYFQDFDAFLHGSLHWTNHTQDFICCFDVDNEKFGKLLLPIPQTQACPNSDLALGVIHGRLCAVYFRRTEVEIWAMKEYGVETSWVRMLNFPVCIGDATISLVLPSVLFSLNEEEIVIYDFNKGLFSYDLKRNKLRCCMTSEGKKVNEAYTTAYNPSFVSLHDVAKGEQVMSSRTMQLIQ